MPEDEDSLDEPPLVPRATRGRMIEDGLISDNEDSQTEPQQHPPPVTSPGNEATVRNEPMFTWAKYGLTVPLELWEARQARENSLAQPGSAPTLSAQAEVPRGNPQSAAEYIAYAASASAQPKSAQTKYSHWQAVANIPKKSGIPANRSVAASTAKARGLAAMNSQMQAFVPGTSNQSPAQNRLPEGSPRNTVIEHFDLATDDNSSMSSWSLAQ